MGIWNKIFGKTSKVSEVVEEEDDVIITKQNFSYFIKNDLKVTYDLIVGDRVILVGNEKDSVTRGYIKEYMTITQAKNIVAVVTDEDTDVDYIAMGILIPYDEEMYDKLISLSSTYSAWNYVSPSWTQIKKDGSKVFRSTEDSLIWRKYENK